MPKDLHIVNLEDLLFSFSSIDMWLRCGKQFWFRYIRGLKEPPNVNLVEGNSYHEALRLDNLQLIKKGKPKTPKKMIDIFMSDFRQRIKDDCKKYKIRTKDFDWKDEKENVIFARSKILFPEHFRKYSSKSKPESAEEWFERDMNVNGVKFRLRGKIDKTEKLVVTDYKVSAKVKSEKIVKNSLQLSLYTFIKHKREARIINFVKSVNPYIAEFNASKTLQDMNWALNVTAEVVTAIRSNTFIPTSPESWNCNRKFCGFYDRCRGAR